MEPPVFPPPAPPTPLSTWRTRLQPWLDVLQFKLRLTMSPLPTRQQMRDVWISLNYFETDDFDLATWTHTMEALELLDLLVHVDANVGWAVLLEMTRVDRVFRINESALFDATAVRPRYALELDDSEMLAGLVLAFHACRRLVDIEYTPERSHGFVEMEQLLLSAWRDQHNGQPFHRGRDDRISIKPRLRVESNMKFRSLLHELDLLVYDALRAEVTWATAATDERSDVTSPFVMYEMDVLLLCNNPSHETVVDTLLTIAEGFIAITNLVIHPSLLKGDKLDALVQTLLCPAEGRVGLERLEFTSRYFLTEEITSALSKSLPVSRGLVEFVVSGTGDAELDREQVEWDASWLANAVLKAANPHGIQSLVLKVDDLQITQVDRIREELESSAEVSTAASPIKHLSLDYVDLASRSGVLALLGLVGGSLDRLTLRHYGVDSFSFDFMDAVLLSCPRLKRLDIEQAGVSLEWLYTPRADGHSRGLPESLVLEGRLDNGSILDFFQTLLDKGHDLTKTLKHLHCTVWGGKTPSVETMDAWLHMLASNRLLERSEIVMNEFGMSAYQVAKYTERFEAYDGEPLVDLRKLAFLSVFAPRYESLGLVMQQPTPECVQLITDFVSRSKRRICG